MAQSTRDEVFGASGAIAGDDVALARGWTSNSITPLMKKCSRSMMQVSLERACRARPQVSAFNSTFGLFATCTQTWTCGEPRKYQTKDGPSSRQLSHSPSLPRSPSA